MQVFEAKSQQDGRPEEPAGLSHLDARRRLEREGPNEMVRPPRKPSAGLFDRTSFRSVAVGVTLAVGTIGLYVANLGAGEERARALGFATLVLGQVVLVLTERSPDQPLWRSAPWANGRLVPLLALTIVGLVVALSVPPVAAIFRVVPLEPSDWFVAATVALATTLWGELVKVVRGGHEKPEGV